MELTEREIRANTAAPIGASSSLYAAAMLKRSLAGYQQTAEHLPGHGSDFTETNDRLLYWHWRHTRPWHGAFGESHQAVVNKWTAEERADLVSSFVQLSEMEMQTLYREAWNDLNNNPAPFWTMKVVAKTGGALVLAGGASLLALRRYGPALTSRYRAWSDAKAEAKLKAAAKARQKSERRATKRGRSSRRGFSGVEFLMIFGLLGVVVMPLLAWWLGYWDPHLLIHTNFSPRIGLANSIGLAVGWLSFKLSRRGFLRTAVIGATAAAVPAAAQKPAPPKKAVLPPIPIATNILVAPLILQLDDPSSAVRQAAIDALIKLGRERDDQRNIKRWNPR